MCYKIYDGQDMTLWPLFNLLGKGPFFGRGGRIFEKQGRIWGGISKRGENFAGWPEYNPWSRKSQKTRWLIRLLRKRHSFVFSKDWTKPLCQTWPGPMPVHTGPCLIADSTTVPPPFPSHPPSPSFLHNRFIRPPFPPPQPLYRFQLVHPINACISGMHAHNPI